jgi:hypothetical protein
MMMLMRRKEKKSIIKRDRNPLKLVVVVLVTGNLGLKTLALTHGLDDLAGEGGLVKWRSTGEDLPVVEHHLGEGLAGGGGTEIGVETEGLLDGKVGLDVEERSTGALGLLEDVTSPAGEDGVDTTHGVLGNLDLDQEDGLEETGVGEKGCGVEDTTSSRDDLTTTTVNGIGVEGDIHDVEADRAHGLLGNGTFLGGPLETRDNGILDFVEVLDSLGLVNQQVGTVGIGTETPDLAGISDVPAEVIGERASTGLEIVTGRHFAILDSLGELLLDGLSNHVKTVVLVGGLGQSSDA